MAFGVANDGQKVIKNNRNLQLSIRRYFKRNGKYAIDHTKDYLSVENQKVIQLNSERDLNEKINSAPAFNLKVRVIVLLSVLTTTGLLYFLTMMI